MPCASACSAARPAAAHDCPIPLPAKPTYASSTISPCFPIAFDSRPYVSLSHAFHASCNCSNDPSTISVSSRPRGRGALAGPPRPAAAAQSSSPDGLSASLTSRGPILIHLVAHGARSVSISKRRHWRALYASSRSSHCPNMHRSRPPRSSLVVQHAVSIPFVFTHVVH